MHDTFLRLFVVVAGLLFPKEHTVILEHDDDIITGMQEREGLLQRELAKLERELDTVAKDTMLEDHLERLESHSFQHPREQSSGQIKSEHEGQSLSKGNFAKESKEINESKPPDQKNYQIEDVVELENEESSSVSKEVPPQQEVSVEHHGLPPMGHETSNGELAEVKLEVHQTPLSENIEAQDAKQGGQPSRHDVSDPELSFKGSEDRDASHIGETLSQNDQQLDTGLRRRSQLKPERSQTSSNSEYIWYLCNAYSLFSLIRILVRFLRGNSLDQEMPEPPQHDPQIECPITAEICVPDQGTLMGFYDRYVHVPPHESQRVCEFVEGFVDDLLAVIRETSRDQADMEVEDLIEVGSLYESWCTGRTLTCDLWVPISPCEPYRFQVQLSVDQNGNAAPDVQGYGRVKMLKAQSTTNGCPCSQTSKDSDVLCLLHTNDKREDKRNEVRDAVDGPLCCEKTPYLSRTNVARWFRSAVRKAWEHMSHKYELELSFQSRESPGALRIRFRSGRTIHFNIMPVVKFEDTDVCLASYLTPKRKDSTPESQWPLLFSRYEQSLLRYLSKRLPQNACHLNCLQILSFLNKKQIELTGDCSLSSHHLKTVLLHLLLEKEPSEWGPEHSAGKLRDMLDFLKGSLQKRWLSHALVGNPLVPEESGLPPNVRQSKPINILEPLLNQGHLYTKTVQHFEEMLKNMPVLIQEYMNV